MGDLYNHEHGIADTGERRSLPAGTEETLISLAILASRLQETSSWDSVLLQADIDILEQTTNAGPDISTKPPASEEVLSNLPRLQISTRPNCPICTEEISPTDTATKLPCNHTFHLDCLLTWLRRNCSCPLCREELPTDDAEYEEEKRVARRRAGAAAMQNQMFN